MHENFRTAVAELLAEITTARDANRVPLEGMRNFMRDATETQQGLLEAAQQRARAYEAEIVDWNTLETAVKASLTALDVVEQDQTRPKLKVTAEVYAQFQEKIASETAALADVETLPDAASSGTFTLSAGREK